MEKAREFAVVNDDRPVSDALLLHKAIVFVLGGSGAETVKSRVTEYLGYKDDESGYAIIDLLTLTNKVTTQIQAIDLPDRQKNALKRRFGPCHKLMDFSTYAQNIPQFKNSSLNEHQADELLTIDLVLQGGGFANPVLKDDKVIGEILTTLINEVKTSDLPTELKNAILFRLLQIERSLRNASVLGSSVLLDDITKLVGALDIVASEQTGEAAENKKKINTIKAKVVAASKKIRTARHYAKDAAFITGSIQAAIPLIEHLVE